MPNRAIPDELLDALRQDMIERRIRSGMERLDRYLPLVESLDPCVPGGPQALWQIAQWVDAGWRDIGLVRAALERLPQTARASLSLRDYAAIRMAEGMSAMSAEDTEEAVAHFSAVLLLAPDLDDPEIAATAHFCTARCQRKRGDYDAALKHALTASSIALECSYGRMAAVMRVLESWIYFQKGRHKEALKTLAETEVVLAAAGDALVLGNIQSTYGRIYRQEGRYDRAISHFQQAIAEYRKVDNQHPSLARTLSNMAYAERVVALDLRRRLEEDLKRRRAGRATGAPAAERARYREEFERIRNEAHAHLNEAEAVYAIHPNHRGLGTVRLNRGLLELDNGDLDRAEEEAAAAFALGKEKEDSILMARARLLQCMIENGKLEEGIDDDPRRHAEAALEYIRDAIESAQKTQNRRLLARVHTWHGLTLSNEFFQGQEAALNALNTASSYLDHGFHDTAWHDLHTLKTRVSRTRGVDETLLAWSQGAVGNRTFRELEEQFAEIVIPRIWEMEGRKIARVATRLSVSPKKVRRALRRAGLLQRAGAPQADAASGIS